LYRYAAVVSAHNTVESPSPQLGLHLLADYVGPFLDAALSGRGGAPYSC
jgi:hypothetical protein